jgi:hypothetical protein
MQRWLKFYGIQADELVGALTTLINSLRAPNTVLLAPFKVLMPLFYYGPHNSMQRHLAAS